MRTTELTAGKALRLWQEVCLGLVTGDTRDLTLRQMSILFTVYLEPPPHTVRALSARLNVTKPVVTRALDTMGRMELVKRRRDPSDRRNVLIQRTVEGSLYLENLAELIMAKAEQA